MYWWHFHVSVFICTRFGVDDALWLIFFSFSFLHHISALEWFQCLPTKNERDAMLMNFLLLLMLQSETFLLSRLQHEHIVLFSRFYFKRASRDDWEI